MEGGKEKPCTHFVERTPHSNRVSLQNEGAFDYECKYSTSDKTLLSKRVSVCPSLPALLVLSLLQSLFLGSSLPQIIPGSSGMTNHLLPENVGVLLNPPSWLRA